MPTTWVEMAGEFVAGRYLNAATFTKLRQRQRAIASHVQEVFMATNTFAAASYPTFSAALLTRPFYVPSFARYCRFNLMAYQSVGGGTGYLRGELIGKDSAGAVLTILSSETTLTALSPTFALSTISWSGTIAALARQSAILNVKVSHATGGTTTFNTAPSGIIKEIGLRFSWD